MSALASERSAAGAASLALGESEPLRKKHATVRASPSPARDQAALAKEALVLHFNEFVVSDDMLQTYAFAILNTHGCDALRLPSSRIAVFIGKIRALYKDNPYHGWSHGFFVLRVSCLFLDVLPGLQSRLSRAERCSYLIAALCHDVAHTGTNNTFEVRTKSVVALTYGDDSVLEKMHIATMFQVMDDPTVQLLSGVEQEEQTKLRALMASAVLMTDMANHANQMQDLQEKVKASALTKILRGSPLQKGETESTRAEDTQCILNIVMHAADISSHMMPVEISEIWSGRVLDEFRAISAAEGAAGLALTPFLSGLDNPLRAAECQLGFLEHCVSPLWTLLMDAVDMVDVADSIKSVDGTSSVAAAATEPEAGGASPTLLDTRRDLMFHLRKNLEDNRLYWGNAIANAARNIEASGEDIQKVS